MYMYIIMLLTNSVEKAVEAFINSEDFSSHLVLGATPDIRKIHFAFQLMKVYVLVECYEVSIYD